MKRIAATIILVGALAANGFAYADGRKENQQDRIANGVQSGQLTPGETANIENQERAINGETRADRNANGGKLTDAERHQIETQRNGLSKTIYQDKHNGRSDHFGNSEVGKREENQQDRIAQGIRSGKLNAGETANLQSREAAVNQEVRADRRADSGHLTASEKRQVNRQQNHLSRAIHHDKAH